jgi:hypothetical protein
MSRWTAVNIRSRPQAQRYGELKIASQVASHAQKYFLRDSAAANHMRKRQRPSIHDIRCATSVPTTRLEQDQLKVSLQRINKQSMELEMNAASTEYHGTVLRQIRCVLAVAK